MHIKSLLLSFALTFIFQENLKASEVENKQPLIFCLVTTEGFKRKKENFNIQDGRICGQDIWDTAKAMVHPNHKINSITISLSNDSDDVCY